MPQFDLANASLSSSGLTKIKTAEKYIPFVYDDGYPLFSAAGLQYLDNDPKPSSATTNYISDFYGRVPYDPNYHGQIRGTLTIGYGTTLDGVPGKDTLFNQIYSTGISIGGTTYIFPAEFLDANATNSTGGFFKNEAGNQVTNASIKLKYTGNDSTNSTKVFSATLAEQLLQDKLSAIETKVKSVFDSHKDAFPYDNTLAQQHYDLMVAICFHQGQAGFEHSFFVDRYKLVDGTSVTTTANLTAYNDAAYALMWLASVGKDGTYFWVQPQIDRRNNDIDELVGTAGSRTFPTTINPITQPDWYQGAAIPVDYFENKKNVDFGLDGSIGARNSTSRTVASDEQQVFFTPSVDFHTGASSALIANLNTDVPDYYTGNRSIYSTEPGSATFYENDPLYQKYYSKFWQPNEKFYHGADVVGAPRTATNHGAVFAANPDGQTPAFILGLNEDGAGTSKVYIRSSLSQSTISSGTDTTIWDIANGQSMGTINYGQWNHFAITRKGNIFRTFKNGTKVSEFTSPKPITRNTRDGTLKFSIGRSQGSDYFKGYIDGLRVTKGTALYTANFTAPSSELSTTSTTGLYNGEHYVETVYSAINTISEQLGTEYRVNTTGTLDAGKKEVLFGGHGTNEPPAIIVRDVSGEDPAISGLTPEQITAQFDAEDYVSGVELLTQAEGSSQQADHAEAFDNNTPYRDLFGADLERVQFVGENNIPNIQRNERALAYLNEFKKVKKTLSLSLEEYDLQGDFNVGDMIYVYDPEIRFEDTEAKRIEDGRDSLFEVAYRGQIINPEKIRITGITWPVKDGYGVYLRKVASTSPYRVEYIDLSDYVSWETGNTQLDIGDLQKRIGEDLRFSSAVTGVVSGTRQTGVRKPRHPDTLVEGDLKLTSATVQDDLGRDNAIIFVQWEEPTYDNGSPVQNGLQYQIDWKPTNTTGDYQSSFINWNSTNDFTIEGLQLNTSYEVRVIAILTNANTSDPATGTVTTALDTNAPSKPGPAATIAAGALRVQIVHNLGRAEDDDGNAIGSIVDFTLQRDTHHLNVYASTTSGFSLSSANDKEQHKVGELNVGSASIKHQIPVVGEIQMPNGSTHYFRFTAVDNAGNESTPSDEQSANGNLVATANISDAAITTAKINNLAVTDAKIDTLTAGKITAGTISGQEIIVGTNTSDSAVIKSSNYSTGSAGWKIDSDGTVEFESGTFRGNLDGAGGTFSGTISANQVTGGTLDFSSVTAGSLDFSSLSVQAGDIVAEIAAGEITNSLIGDVSVSKLTSGSIVGNSIVLGSSGNTSGSISSHNFSSGSAGFSIDYDGNAEFNTVEIRIPTSSGSSDEDIPSGGQKIEFGAVPIYDFNGNLNIHPASGKSVIIHNGNPFVIKGETGSAQMRFEGAGSIGDFIFDLDFVSYSTAQSDSTRRYSNPTPFTQIREFYFENDNTQIFRANEQNADIEFFGDIGVGSNSFLYINGNNGSNGDVLKRTATGMEWGTGSGAAHPDSDHSFDNYGSWTLKRGGSTVGNVSSGFGASWNAGSGLSVSSNNNPFTITYSADFGGGNSQVARGDHSHTGTGISQINSPSVGLFSSYTFNTSGGQFSVSTTRSNDASYSFRNVFPTSGTASDLGHQFGNGRWRRLYTLNSPSVSSDERLKENIVDIPYGLDYINSLEPKQYNLKRVIVRGCNTCEMEIDEGVDECWNCTENGDTADIVDNLDVTGEKSGVVNFGFTAQDLISTPPEPDVDIALVDYDEDSDEYGVRYNELIAPLVKAVQELSTQISDLTDRIEALEG